MDVDGFGAFDRDVYAQNQQRRGGGQHERDYQARVNARQNSA